MQSIPLSQYLVDIKSVINKAFAESWVTAELLSISNGANRYLELVEYDGDRREVAKTRAVVWKGDANLISIFEKETGSTLQAGMKLLVKAKPTYHESYGFQLRIQGLDPTYTLGDMEARMKEIRKFLAEKGVWALNKSRFLPGDFTRLAVIAPPEAAGLGDFRVEADRLQALGICHFDYFQCAFQGENPGDLIVDSMARAVNQHKECPYEALIIIRGGGDKSGLYQLNHKRLAHAVCRMPIPVLIGIGHERDKLLLDEVAHTRFATPSLVIAHIKEAIVRSANKAYENYQNLTQIAHQVVDRAEQDADSRAHQLFLNANNQLSLADERADNQLSKLMSTATLQIEKSEAGADRQFEMMRAHADMALQIVMDTANEAKNSLFTHAHKQLDKAQANADNMISEVLAANPIAILKRGYAYAQSDAGFVTSSQQALPGQTLTLTFSDGPVRAVVEA